MRLIDMNVNPVADAAGDRLTAITASALEDYCASARPVLDACGIERAVIVVLTDRPVGDVDAASAFRQVTGDGRFSVSMAVDFRAPDASRRLEQARALGVAGLKFHAYMQRIEVADHEAAVRLSRQASALGMYVMVCCSYGTRALDRFSGLRLAAAIAGEVACPVVMSHAGGRQVLDAMLVAEDAPNVFLETSFSLPYYVGSTVENDFAFAMKKLGARRWLYGSDAPFVPFDRSFAVTRAFFDRHGFGARDVEAIMYDTASAIIERARA